MEEYIFGSKLAKKLRRPARRYNWYKDAPTDMLGSELAYGCFNDVNQTINFERAEEIIAHFRSELIRIEQDWAPIRD